MVPLLLNKYCRAEWSCCWLITSCNPWTVPVRAASICSGQRQVNIWSSWSALVSWDCQSCRSNLPLKQIIDLHEATEHRAEAAGLHAPPAQRTTSLDRVPVTQIRPDTMHDHQQHHPQLWAFLNFLLARASPPRWIFWVLLAIQDGHTTVYEEPD